MHASNFYRRTINLRHVVMLDGVCVAVVPRNDQAAPICSENGALIGSASPPANAVLRLEKPWLPVISHLFRERPRHGGRRFASGPSWGNAAQGLTYATLNYNPTTSASPPLFKIAQCRSYCGSDTNPSGRCRCSEKLFPFGTSNLEACCFTCQGIISMSSEKRPSPTARGCCCLMTSMRQPQAIVLRLSCTRSDQS